MTGYGAAESTGSLGRFRAEIRGINSRFLEVRVRVPAQLAPFEADFKKRISESFRRGRLDLVLNWEAADDARAPVALNTAVARAYIEAADHLRRDLGLQGDLDVAEILKLPGVAETARSEVADPALRDQSLVAIDAAIRDAAAMRQAEGEAIGADIRARVEAVSKLKGEIASRATSVPGAAKRRLEERLARLGVDASLDPARLAQEVAYLADRSDIAEELARLDAHVDRCRSVLGKDDQPAGKTLEFLAQELHREANTIGSKSSDVAMTGLVLDLKTEIERIREQVLNLE